MENEKKIVVIETKAYKMADDVAEAVEKHYNQVMEYIETSMEPKQSDSDVVILEKALALYQAASHLKKRISRAFPRDVFEKRLELQRLMRWEDILSYLFAGKKVSNLNFKDGEYVMMQDIFPVIVNKEGKMTPFMGIALTSNKCEWYVLPDEEEVKTEGEN